MDREPTKHALEELIRLERPIQQAIDDLPSDWADREELAIIRVDDVERLLTQFLAGRVSRDDVYAWADALELRDDVGRQPGYRLMLNDFLFDRANPELNGPLTKDAATTWLARLRVAAPE